MARNLFAESAPKGRNLFAKSAGVDPDVPTDENLAMSEAQAKPEASFYDKALGVPDAAASLISGMTTGTLGQLAGGAYDAVTGGRNEQGDNPLTQVEQPQTMAEKLSGALTIEPRTQSGQEYVKNISEVAGSLPPYMGLPMSTGVSQTLKSLKRPLSKNYKKALSQVAPSNDNLKDAAKVLYNEIEDAGIKVPRNDYLNFAMKLNNDLRKSGLDENLTPKTMGVLKRIETDFENNKTGLTDLEQVRKLANIATKQFDNPTEQSLGIKIKNSIDDFVQSEASKNEGSGGNVGELYTGARNLTQRRKKAELLDEAILKSEQAASGFENGLRNELRSILKNRKKRSGFNQEEIQAMKQITQGGTLENTLKKLGKIGFGADQQTNMLLGAVGAGAGASLGAQMFGPGGAAVGATIIPAIGQVSANAAKKLASKNQAFLNDLTRSGKSGNGVVKSYLKNIPRGKQSREELAALLLDPKIDITDIEKLSGKYKKGIVDDAVFMANKLKAAQLAAYANASNEEQAEETK